VDATCTTLRAWALHFAARGWHVFPITPGAKKPPVIDRWETRASTDPDQINHWWQHIPRTIGIATGPSGLVVVDLDTPKPGQTTPDRWATLGIGSGAGVLRALAPQRGATVTPTYAVTTPSGGWHLYYTTPPGTKLRNTHNVIGWKIICSRSSKHLLTAPSRGEACEARSAAGSAMPPHARLRAMDVRSADLGPAGGAV
jgi:hypothetical protein